MARVTYTDNIPGDAIPADTVDNDGDGTGADATPVNMDGVAVLAVTDAAVQASDPANTSPTFPDQDPNTAGDQSDETSRSVAENTPAKQSIGAPVTASDEDQELLLYTLGGPDADSFGISRINGQLTTKAELDYETKNTYTVVVTATDPSGAADSILVTINVTDVDDPAAISAPSALDYAENGTGPVATFSATDQDGDAIVWSLAASGDYKLFTIDGGVLAFKTSPDYEKPGTAVGGTIADRNVYNVTIEATGGSQRRSDNGYKRRRRW